MDIYVVFLFLIIFTSTFCDDILTKLKFLSKFEPSDFVKHLSSSNADIIGDGGRIIRASVSQFPVLEGEGISMGLNILGIVCFLSEHFVLLVTLFVSSRPMRFSTTSCSSKSN